MMNNQNSLSSLVPANAAISKSQDKAQGSNKREKKVAKKPAKLSNGRVGRTKGLSSQDFQPVVSKSDLPEPPKKPATIYLAFKNELTKKLKESNKEITFTEITKKVS